MPDDLEKRVSLLERGQDAFKFQLDAITKGIGEIKESLVGINNLGGRVGTLEVRMEAAWKKIDHCSVEMDSFRHIKSEHDVCKPKVDVMCTSTALLEHRLKSVEESITNAGKLVQGRVTSFADKILWAVFVVAGLSAAIFAINGVIK